jgi:hypothetical protein
MPHRNSRSETIELDMTIDTPCSVGNTTDIAFSLPRSQKYPPPTISLKLPALFLLYLKKWTWPLKNIPLNNTLLKFNQVWDFKRTNVI